LHRDLANCDLHLKPFSSPPWLLVELMRCQLLFKDEIVGAERIANANFEAHVSVLLARGGKTMAMVLQLPLWACWRASP
jgi:hypothetical protein